MTFNAIDTNGNLEIDLKEALELDSFEMDESLETAPSPHAGALGHSGLPD